MEIDKTVKIQNPGQAEVTRACAPQAESAPESTRRCLKCGSILSPHLSICPKCGAMDSRAFAWKPGMILKGKYRLLNPLVSGGFGDIFLCNPVGDTKTRYVLKVLHDFASLENQERFEREARIMHMMEYPVIVKFIDYWSSDSCAFIVMEYINGYTLAELIRKFDIDELTTLQLALEVARALRYAWETASIIHRDIKPSNIMVNQDMEVKLLDFGMAKQTGPDGTTGITANRCGVGTPGYMSPEQYKDAKNVDFKTDIYSLGATMYFLLKKKPLVPEHDFFEAFQHTKKMSPPPQSSFLGICSDECATLIRSMLELDPCKRPANYNILVAQLKALINVNQG